METAKLKRVSFIKALDTLVEIAKEPESTIVRDATIQRFEYTFDLSWKALKAWLFDVHGIVCHSPKSCLREAFSLQMFDESDTEFFFTDGR